MTFSDAFVLEKLAEVGKYQEELGRLLEFSDQDILGDSGRMHIAERLLQLLVDTTLDINQHFIKELNLDVAEDFQSTFYILGRQGILEVDFVEKIAPVVGLRNRVVHRYETLDKKLFLQALRQNYKDFDVYAKLIKQHLEKLK